MTTEYRIRIDTLADGSKSYVPQQLKYHPWPRLAWCDFIDSFYGEAYTEKFTTMDEAVTFINREKAKNIAAAELTNRKRVVTTEYVAV